VVGGIFFREGQFAGIRRKSIRHGHGDLDESKADFFLQPGDPGPISRRNFSHLPPGGEFLPRPLAGVFFGGS